MGATLEPITLVLRAGPNHAKHGDPYTSSAAVQKIGEAAYVQGASAESLWAYRKAVIAAFRALGVTEIHYQRMKNGVVRDVVVRI